MADYDDLPYIVIERRSGAVAPFLWGALIGAAVALLWAPRSGRETQRELREAAERLRLAARERVDDARDAVDEVVGGVRQRVQEQVEAVREAVETRAEGLRHAVESGRRAARDARHELEARLAEAKREARGEPATELAGADVVASEIGSEPASPRPERG